MTDTKSLDVQIAEKELEIEKLKAEAAALKAKASFQEFPKHVQVPVAPYVDKPTQTVVVNSAAEEKAALASAQHTGETAAQYDARLKAEAAKAKSEADKK
jgi:hypothetical protein